MAVRLLTIRGVAVTAVCSAPNHDLVRSLGADRALDYKRGDFAQDETRHDLALDCVGMLPGKSARARLKPGGTYLTVGGMDSAKELESDLKKLATW